MQGVFCLFLFVKIFCNFNNYKEGEKKMISFNIPPYIGTEMKYIQDAINSHKISGDGKYTKKCNEWLEEKTGAEKVLLTCYPYEFYFHLFHLIFVLYSYMYLYIILKNTFIIVAKFMIQ